MPPRDTPLAAPPVFPVTGLPRRGHVVANGTPPALLPTTVTDGVPRHTTKGATSPAVRRPTFEDDVVPVRAGPQDLFAGRVKSHLAIFPLGTSACREKLTLASSILLCLFFCGASRRPSPPQDRPADRPPPIPVARPPERPQWVSPPPVGLPRRRRPAKDRRPPQVAARIGRPKTRPAPPVARRPPTAARDPDPPVRRPGPVGRPVPVRPPVEVVRPRPHPVARQREVGVVERLPGRARHVTARVAVALAPARRRPLPCPQGGRRPGRPVSVDRRAVRRPEGRPHVAPRPVDDLLTTPAAPVAGRATVVAPTGDGPFLV